MMCRSEEDFSALNTNSRFRLMTFNTELTLDQLNATTGEIPLESDSSICTSGLVLTPPPVNNGRELPCLLTSDE